jgi:hypothetical protein
MTQSDLLLLRRHRAGSPRKEVERIIAFEVDYLVQRGHCSGSTLVRLTSSNSGTSNV